MNGVDWFRTESDMSYDDDKKVIDSVLREIAAAQIGRLSSVLKQYFAEQGSDITVSDFRGFAMISVADEGLKTFETDSTLKAYSAVNHMFADLLVPISKDVTYPIVFWLSLANRPGIVVSKLDKPSCYVLSLGNPYSFGEVCASLNYVLEQQNVSAKPGSDWFAKIIEKQGLDPSDSAFRFLVGRT